MKREEREQAVFVLSDDEVRKLSTSELKYVCKHTLLNIKYKYIEYSPYAKRSNYYKNRTLRNRKEMAEEVIKRRKLITPEQRQAYELRQSRLAEFRNCNQKRRDSRVEPYKSFREFWEAEHPEIPYQPAAEFYAENGVDVTARDEKHLNQMKVSKIVKMLEHDFPGVYAMTDIETKNTLIKHNDVILVTIRNHKIIELAIPASAVNYNNINRLFTTKTKIEYDKKLEQK